MCYNEAMNMNHESRITSESPAAIFDPDVAQVMAEAGDSCRSTAACLRMKTIDEYKGYGADRYDAHGNMLETEAGLKLIEEEQAKIDAARAELDMRQAMLDATKKSILAGAALEHSISPEYWGKDAKIRLAEKYGLPLEHWVHIETPGMSIVTYGGQTGIPLGDRNNRLPIYVWWDAIKGNDPSRAFTINGKEVDYKVEVAGETFDTRMMTAEAYALLVKEVMKNDTETPLKSGLLDVDNWVDASSTLLLGEYSTGRDDCFGVPIGYVKSRRAWLEQVSPNEECTVDFRPTIIRKHP